MSGGEPLVSARGLRRTFRTFQRRPGLVGALRDLFALGGTDRVALQGLDLDIFPGERVALIGPNGAGKSTTVKLLCGILSPTSGELLVSGRRPHRERQAHVRDIGVVFGQRTQLWWDLAVIEAFDLLAAVFLIPPADYRARLERFDTVLGIGELLGQPVRELSLGQRMRCDIAAALLHQPPLLLLDEPTIGLDVSVKLRIRDFIREINAEQGTTVVLTTHDLSDVEAVCDRVLLIDRGQLLFDGTVPALKAQLGGRRRLVVDLPSPISPEAQAALVSNLPAEASWHEGRQLALSFSAADVRAAALIQVLLERTEIEDLSVEEPSIDEVVARFYDESGP
ncbi:MAG: ABC-2 type transport system ATP-binding protein [Myxococcota bacterium]